MGGLLIKAEFAYDFTRHTSTQEPPLEVVYASAPSTLIARVLDLDTHAQSETLALRDSATLRQCKENLRRAQVYQKRYADTKRRPITFKPGATGVAELPVS